jgi:hypothetical protein
MPPILEQQWPGRRRMRNHHGDDFLVNLDGLRANPRKNRSGFRQGRAIAKSRSSTFLVFIINAAFDDQSPIATPSRLGVKGDSLSNFQGLRRSSTFGNLIDCRRILPP